MNKTERFKQVIDNATARKVIESEYPPPPVIDPEAQEKSPEDAPAMPWSVCILLCIFIGVGSYLLGSVLP